MIFPLSFKINTTTKSGTIFKTKRRRTLANKAYWSGFFLWLWDLNTDKSPFFSQLEIYIQENPHQLTIQTWSTLISHGIFSCSGNYILTKAFRWFPSNTNWYFLLLTLLVSRLWFLKCLMQFCIVTPYKQEQSLNSLNHKIQGYCKCVGNIIANTCKIFAAWNLLWSRECTVLGNSQQVWSKKEIYLKV